MRDVSAKRTTPRLAPLFAATVIVLFVAQGPAAAAAPSEIVFTKLVDTQTPAPGGTGTFAGFFSAAFDGERVAFVGRNQAFQALGVYLYASGQPLRIMADGATFAPGTTRPFDFFRNPSVDGDNVGFNANASGSPFLSGTYARVGPSLIRIADNTSQGGSFNGFSNSAIDGNRVAFSGNNGVYRGDGTTRQLIAGPGTPLPDGSGSFTSVNSEIVARDDGLVFYGAAGAQAGVYKRLNGSLVEVADRNTPIPVGSGNFTDFDNASVGFDGLNAAFLGFGNSGQAGVYAESGTTLRRVVDNGVVAPGEGGRFRFPERYVSIDNGHVAFLANTSTSSPIKLYSDIDGTLRRIVGVNDTLFGKVVSSLAIDHQAIAGDSIAFVAGFTDGSSGIFLASIPEPSSLWFLGASLVLSVTRRARRPAPGR